LQRGIGDRRIDADHYRMTTSERIDVIIRVGRDAAPAAD
jgi:hypothetical protein